MPSLSNCYSELVEILVRSESGSRSSPSVEDDWESVVRVVVSRTAGERLAETVLSALNRAAMLEPARLAAASVGELQDTLSQAGAKLPPKVAALLRRLAAWFTTAFGESGIRSREAGVSTSVLREQLLAINGIAAGTADAVLLALGRPSCPIGPGIYRILVRHGWCDITADYDEASESLSRHAGGDIGELDRLVQGLTEVGRRYCGVRAPKCDRCPLLPLLPEGGPIDPHG